MRQILYTTTLFYYDGPQVFEARDGIGGHYIGLLVEPDAPTERYLLAGVRPERLRQFRSGTLDLRSLLVDESGDEWFLATAEDGLGRPFALERQDAPLAGSKFLPDYGFVLHDRPADEDALKEARGRNNLVLEIAVEPPEAAEEHRIRVSTLVGLLGHVQTVVKHAYGAALRGLPLEMRRAIDRSEAHLFDVIVPAEAGSFKILLEAAKTPDLLGQSELARALERVDVLFENVHTPKETLATVKRNKGHLAGAYLRLLRFLAQNKTGLRYSWAEPSFAKSKGHAVREGEVGPLIEVLSGISNLGAEQVSMTGALEKADTTNGTWRIATLEGLYNGKTMPGGPSLEGLKIGGTYLFQCVEEIEEIEGTGREQRTLYLAEHEPV